MDAKTFKDKLKITYYDLLTTPKSKEYFFVKLAEDMQRLLNTIFTSVYILNDNTLQQVSLASSLSNSHFLKEDLIDEHIRNSIMSSKVVELKKEDILNIELHNINLISLSLCPTNGPFGIVVLGFESPNKFMIENSLFETVHQELNQLVGLVYKLEPANNVNKYQELYEAARSFSVLKGKTDILAEIITRMKDIYPQYEFTLLLSQDHDDTKGLPVKPIELNDNSLSAKAFLNGDLIIDTLQNKTYIYVPLKGSQGIYGVLKLLSNEPTHISETERFFLEEFANTAGRAIENRSLYQYSTHLVTDLKLVNDLTHQLNSNLDLVEITKMVRDKIIQVCKPGEVGFAYKKKETTQQFELLEGSTTFFETIEGRSFTRDLAMEISEKKEPIFIGEANDEEFQSYRSIMAFPMENLGDINGVVIVLHQDPYAFSFDQFKLLQSIIRHSTLAIVNTILKERLEKVASTDYLTQLYSRNYLDEKIVEHMQNGELGTLILFDIDNFKQVNDTFGHYVGDEVIKQVSDIILSTIDERDIAARWGGEELAIYLPNTELNDGVHLARMISTQVENFTEPRVTLSAGVSAWSSLEDDTPRRFFIRADKALYEAKSYGKNCVVKYSLEDEKGENVQMKS